MSDYFGYFQNGARLAPPSSKPERLVPSIRDAAALVKIDVGRDDALHSCAGLLLSSTTDVLN